MNVHEPHCDNHFMMYVNQSLGVNLKLIYWCRSNYTLIKLGGGRWNNIVSLTQTYQIITSTWNKYKKLRYLAFYFSHQGSSRYFILTIHLNLDQPHFKCSEATLRFMASVLDDVGLQTAACYSKCFKCTDSFNPHKILWVNTTIIFILLMKNWKSRDSKITCWWTWPSGYNYHTIYQEATGCMTDTELHIQTNSLMCSKEQSWRITANTPILHTAASLI